MGRRFSLSLAAIVVLGVLVAAVVAVVTDGDPFDMQSFRLVRRLLGDDFFGLYSALDGRLFARWPYPPAFLPVVSGASGLSNFTGVSFETVLRAAPILATAAIALVAQDFLGRQGASERTRLAAAALISLGPSFVVIGGYHGQIDAVAILPAVVALHRWQYALPSRRAIEAGLLIGLGGAVKTIPLLMVLALLPSARSWREGATVLAAGAAVPLALFLPFALGGGLPALSTLTYRGVGGSGGLSLVVQPDLPQVILGIRKGVPFEPSEKLADLGPVFVLAGLAIVTALGVRARPPAPVMAVFLWLVVLALGVNFFFQYALWALPFLVMAGYLRAIAAAQAALLAAMLIFYLRPWEQSLVGWTYSVLMIALWGVVCVSAFVLGRRLLTRSVRPAPATS